MHYSEKKPCYTCLEYGKQLKSKHLIFHNDFSIFWNKTISLWNYCCIDLLTDVSASYMTLNVVLGECPCNVANELQLHTNFYLL